MAAGLETNMKIYQEQFAGQVNELLAQQGNIFNAASNGAISLSTKSRRADYVYNSFFSAVGSTLAARRDLTSLGAQTDTNLAQDEHVTVKLSRKIIPIGMARDAFRKAFGHYSQEEFTSIVAEQAANAMQIEMCDTALLAVSRALKNESASYYTETSMGSISSQTLVNILKKMGDRADRVVCWVMHSKAYYDLVLNQINANITPLSNFNIATGTPVTLNRPVIITDSASLKTQLNSPDVDNYYTMGLVEGAVEVENSEEQEVVVQDVTGLENLVIRFQGEYAYNLGVKGFRYDVSSGGANPTGTNVGTGSNWDKHFTDVKDRAGVVAATL